MPKNQLRLTTIVLAGAALFSSQSFSQEALLEYELKLGRRTVGAFAIDTNSLEGYLSLPFVKDVHLAFSKQDAFYTEAFVFGHQETFDYHFDQDTLVFDEYDCFPDDKSLLAKYGKRQGLSFAGGRTPVDLLNDAFSGKLQDTTQTIIYSRPYTIVTDQHPVLKKGKLVYAVRPLPFDKDAIGSFYINEPVTITAKRIGEVYVPETIKAEIIFKYLPRWPFTVEARLVNNNSRIANLYYNEQTGMYHEKTTTETGKED